MTNIIRLSKKRNTIKRNFGFNQFFVDVGPELANNIPNPGPDGVNKDKLIERNPHSMFLKAAEENEIINIVKKKVQK